LTIRRAFSIASASRSWSELTQGIFAPADDLFTGAHRARVMRPAGDLHVLIGCALLLGWEGNSLWRGQRARVATPAREPALIRDAAR
jgi:hypothetical protein